VSLDWLPWLLAGLGAAAAIWGVRQGRHAARRYRQENENEDSERRRLQVLREDAIWGHEEKAGLPAAVSIFDRLGDIEAVQGKILAEFRTNGGFSLKDDFQRLSGDVREHARKDEAKFTEIHEVLVRLEERE
jgi:hypothetical protein